MATKWVYLFSEGDRTMRNLLGGKGAGLAEMTNAGLPVPPGFTVTTEACLAYFAAGKELPEGMWDQTLAAMKVVEGQTGKRFGDATNPLLVSVRSGARVSMPGMMDTVLNIGLNAQTLQGLAAAANNERFAYDSYRRLIAMFGRTVRGIRAELFEEVLDAFKARTAGKRDTDLTVEMLKQVVVEFKAIYKRELGEDFPEDVWEQLRQGIEAVFHSWYGPNAVVYRQHERIPDTWGTAVNV
ncbi:MAG: PEP/pyruvate-binding domain-containing protein, partial [Chloroflexota bacterium]